jgi:glutamate/tyrosine decarboxylase-like PLP-dependent enzyme
MEKARPISERVESPPPVSAWFAGPKAENAEDFAQVISRIVYDYYYWRRNYYPEDGVVITSEMRRAHDAWQDLFQDKLLELLAALKADYPFYSPRYAAHMLSEQTLPSIAGYVAGMLYNPNNVTREAAPVTVRLELEASALIAEMVGYDKETSWGHLTGGGTVANLEALWVARSVKYLPLLLQEVFERLGIQHEILERPAIELLKMPPQACLGLLQEALLAFSFEGKEGLTRFTQAFRESLYNVNQWGLARILSRLGSEPVILAPETFHYCIPKALDVLGLGKKSLRLVRVDSNFRMDVRDLREKLEECDARDDVHVLAVVAVVGSTEEGAVDPVEKILDVRAEREPEGKASFWLHADAAYGGYLRTTTIPTRIGLGEPFTVVRIGGEMVTLEINLPERNTCDALERLGECDSVVVDPHKLGYVPYPAGAVCYRSSLVKPLLRQEAPYLEPQAPEAFLSGVEGDGEVGGLGGYILEGSKPGATAASVWLSHKTIPLDTRAHGRLVRDTIRNACELHALLEKWEELTSPRSVRALCLCTPGSNIVCYAFRPKVKISLSVLNALNQRIFAEFSIPEDRRARVYDQPFFISRTYFTKDRYCVETVRGFLSRLDVDPQEYLEEGLFLLRSTLMSPWYSVAKENQRYYLVELVETLYERAEMAWENLTTRS